MTLSVAQANTNTGTINYGMLFLFAVIASGNKTLLNRVRDNFFQNATIKSSAMTEFGLLMAIKGHVLQWRNLPDPDTVKGWHVPYHVPPQSAEYYVEELKKRAIYASWKQFNTVMQTESQRPNIQLEPMYNAIMSFKDAVSSIQIADQFKSIHELGEEIRGEVVSRAEGRTLVSIPFGWPTIDMLTGGASGGDLIFVVARPGIGKSNLLGKMSLHAWSSGFKPLLISMEMTDVQISRRILGLKGSFNPDLLRRGEVPDDLLDRLDVVNHELGEHPFYISSNKDRHTVDTIAGMVDELQPDAVYIDAGYLISTSSSTQKAWEKLSVVSEGLKRLATSRNIPIFITVQFNRDAAKSKRFELDNIAGTDAIGQLGSVIIAVTEGEGVYKENRRRLSIVKNREGGVDTIEINNQFNPPNFDEVSDMDDPIFTETTLDERI